MFATYACDPLQTKGRLYIEPSIPHRNEYERDRDRIIHSNAFKRLQYKTQVFINHHGDHYRNRLTHSLEVSSIARSVARTLDLSGDLAESIALVHDLGHTPFGHAGEDALNVCMNKYGGFSHNAHILKIITKLEHRYAAYNGLNLTWETFEGIVKHNGPVDKVNLKKIHHYLEEYNFICDLDLNKNGSAEAQVASLSDDIAYIGHDLEDGITAGIISFDDLSELPYINEYIKQLKYHFKDVGDSRLIYEIIRKVIYYLINDLLDSTKNNLNNFKIKTVDDIRNLEFSVVQFSKEAVHKIIETKNFLYNKFYRHSYIMQINKESKQIVNDLFNIYINNIDLLPLDWFQSFDTSSEYAKAVAVSDYIAGMTDRFAIKQHQLHKQKIN